MRPVQYDTMCALLADSAQVVDALPAEEFQRFHLPGAHHLPLSTLDGGTSKVLDPARPIVTYCYDGAWDVSPRAAWRLEMLGFGEVFDFVGGKVEWLARGEPVEGSDRGTDLIASTLHRAVPIATPELPARDLHALLPGWDAVIVVVSAANPVVVGTVGAPELERAGESTPAAEIMRLGPSTLRPSVPRADAARTLTGARRSYAVVTTESGQLLGIVRTTDLT